MMSDELGLILPSGMFQSDDYIDTPMLGVPSVGAMSAINTAYLSRFRVARPVTLVKLGIYLGGTSGNIDAGIYTFDGVDWQRLISNGGVAAGPANAEQEVAMSATQTLQPGVDYWHAFACSDIGTLTVLRYNGGLSNWMGHGNRCILKTIAGATHVLPATISSPSKASMQISMILITA